MKKYLFIFLALYISQVTSASLFIDKSTMYLIGSDLTVNPVTEFNVTTTFDTIETKTTIHNNIIEVMVSNIIVDLKEHTLSQELNTTSTNFDGIYIHENLSNIVIKNGTIGGTNGIGIYVGDGCSDIHLYDLTVKECDETGILFDGKDTGTGISNCSMRNCSIISCTGADGGPAYGLRMRNCSKFTVADLTSQSNDALTTNSGFGISIEKSEACKLVNCQAVDNGGNTLGVGLYVFDTTDVLCKDCLAYHNVSYEATSTSYGFLLDQCQRILVCQSQSVGNINLSSGGVGFSTKNGSRNIFEGCFSQLNTGGSYAAGFELTNETKSYVTQCTSRGNKALSSGTGYGIYLIGNNDRCYIENNSLVNNSGPTSFGIKDELNPTLNLVMRNYAFDNGTNYSVTYTTGISLPTIDASLSTTSIGIPSGATGSFDNLDISA